MISIQCYYKRSNGTELTAKEWAMPVGLVLASFGWWECFIVEGKDQESTLGLVNWLSQVRYHSEDFVFNHFYVS